MISIIKQILSILSADQKKRLITIQILIVISALFELAGLASIAPFMAVVTDSSVIESNQYLKSFYEFSDVDSISHFIILMAILVLIILTVTSFLSILTVWKLSRFATQVSAENSTRLYTYYLHQDWLFHAMGSTSQLNRKINSEIGRTSLLIQAFLQINSKLTLTAFMLVGLVFYNPMVALIGISTFLIAYTLIFTVVRTRLVTNGRLISTTATVRFKMVSEGFGGIKDLLLLGRQKEFSRRFSKAAHENARAQSSHRTLQNIPKYILEFIVYSALILLVVSLIIFDGNDASDVLPVLAVFGLAGLKLLPAGQQIYASLVDIKANTPALEAIESDLRNSLSLKFSDSDDDFHQMEPKDSIELKNIEFTYPSKSTPVLKSVSINIKVNSLIGIVGPSGSGKSTAVDILLGLIQPSKGTLLVDGKVISDRNKKAWQRNIGYVSQSIFLTEGTIAENIAFAVINSEINYEKIEHVLKLAHMEDFVSKLPDGYDTTVGERGVQLSGGQRQRIGIARALYNDASVLVFDEATSALDGLTERAIMEAIHDFSGSKTIVMIAHRLKTVQKCDQIIYLDAGEVVQIGNYEELCTTNDAFRQMAEHA